MFAVIQELVLRCTVCVALFLVQELVLRCTVCVAPFLVTAWRITRCSLIIDFSVITPTQIVSKMYRIAWNEITELVLTSCAEVLVVKYVFSNAGRFFTNTTHLLVIQFCNTVTVVSHLGSFTF